jgi:hypothetical protein
MNRAREYINFAVKFVGLGYIVLWPLSVTSTSGNVFGAALVCGSGPGAAVDPLCRLPHLFRLSLGLHVVGALFAVLAVLHLAVQAVRAARAQRKPNGVATTDSAFPVKRKQPRFRLRPLPPPRKFGRPRKEFGLRGVPR